MTDDKVKRRMTNRPVAPDVHELFPPHGKQTKRETLGTLRRYLIAILLYCWRRHDGRIVNTWGLTRDRRVSASGRRGPCQCRGSEKFSGRKISQPGSGPSPAPASPQMRFSPYGHQNLGR